MDKMGPATTPTGMRQCADSFRQKRLAFLADYAVAHPLPASFQREAKATIAADWATVLLYYARGHWSAASDEALSKAYFNFLVEVPTQELNRYWGQSIIDNPLVVNFLMDYQSRLVP